jgi:predicted  nucleic acid-binding Zn-ribbon protein
MDEKHLRLLDRINEISTRIDDIEQKLKCSTCSDDVELKAMNNELENLKKTLKSNQFMLTAFSKPPTETLH